VGAQGALRLVALSGVGFGVLCATGCGGSKDHVAITHTPAAIHRLRRAGYTVRNNILWNQVTLYPQPTDAYSVPDNDYATFHDFTVAVYSFKSPVGARRFAKALQAWMRPYAKVPSAGYRLAIAERSVYFGFTLMNFGCARLGLCQFYSRFGPRCGGRPGHLVCPPAPRLPPADFRRIVTTAEGHNA
jgi:hypothetical protein